MFFPLSGFEFVQIWTNVFHSILFLFFLSMYLSFSLRESLEDLYLALLKNLEDDFKDVKLEWHP